MAECKYCLAEYEESQKSLEAKMSYPGTCKVCIFDFIDWYNEVSNDWGDGKSPKTAFLDSLTRTQWAFVRFGSKSLTRTL